MSGINAPTGVGVVVLDEHMNVVTQKGFAAGMGTNQSAEILAAVAGLRLVPAGSVVELRSDSQYVVCTMRDGWKRRANHEHWKLLDAAAAVMASVTWTHVRGHKGEIYNEAADKLAVVAKRDGAVSKLPPAHGEAPAAPTPASVEPDSTQPVAASPTSAGDIVRILLDAVRVIGNIALTDDSDPNLKLAVRTARRAEMEAEVLRIP
jgi:ribonuclease HI